MSRSNSLEKKSQRSVLSTIAIVIATLLTLSMWQVTPSHAASSDTSSATYEQALEQTLEVIEEARATDPASFGQKVDRITASSATMRVLDTMSFRDMTAERQAELFAATASHEVIDGLIQGSELGYLTAVEVNGTVTLSVDGPSKTIEPGEISTAGIAFPQCPSAWAAFTAWFVTTYPYCAAVTTLGFWWGLACAGLTSLGSSVIDFNGGC